MIARPGHAKTPYTAAKQPDRNSPYSVCALGNSHLAAFYNAWKNRPQPLSGKFALSFFPAKTPLLDTISLRGGALVTSDRSQRDRFEGSSGEKRIELARYDAFVLVGLRFNFNLAEACNRLGTIDHAGYGTVEQLVSQALFTHLLRAQFEKAHASKFAEMIRQRSSAPILICPTPLRSEFVLNDPEFAANGRLRNAAFLKPVFDQFRDAAAAAARSRNCEILWQEAQTTGLPGFTKSEYSRASSGDPRYEHDRWHMNDDYGRIHLDAVLKRLDELSGGCVLSHETADPA